MNVLPRLTIHPLLSEVQLSFNQQFTAIAFPRDLLQKNCPQLSKSNLSLELNRDISNQSSPATDFSDSISQALESLLPHNITTIDLVAKLAGMSTRSLQRQLAQGETNYSDLLKALRQQKAIALLTNGATEIDANSMTLMPGMIDCHTHLAISGDFANLEENFTAGDQHVNATLHARYALLDGFTSCRDVGGPTFSLKRAIDQGKIYGPRIL